MRVAARCVLACGLGAAALAAGWAAAAASRVYGLQHEIAGGTERVLVFADGPVSPRFEPRGDRSSVLVLPDTRLDTSAPRSAPPKAGGRVQAVVAREKGTPQQPELEIQVRHEPGARLRLVQRGSQIALEGDAPAQAREEPGLDLNLRNVEIDEVVKRIARHTGTALIYDETLAGQISIMAQQPVTSREALLLLDTVLLMKGFAAVPTPGGPRKIVRIESADSPFVADLAEARGDEPVTTLIRLQQMDTDSMLDALRPMLGTSTLGFSHRPTNSLILAGSAASIARIEDVVRALDATGGEHLFLRRLTWTDAENTAAQLEEAYGDRGLVAAYPDARTNTLAVRARADLVPALREFISRVDRPAETTGELHVFPVQNADPDQLAEILMALQNGGGAGALPGGASQLDVVSQGANQLGGQAYSVVVDPPTHSLVVQATPAVARILRDLVAELDRVPRQVRVEVTVMEVALNSALTLALDALLPLTDPNEPDDLIAFLSLAPSGSFGPLFSGSPVAETFGGVPPVRRSLLGRYARSPIFLPVTLPNGQTRAIAIPRETVAVTADERDIFQRTLLKPHLKLISGEEHEIFVGDNVPIRTEQADTTDPLQIRQNIERQDTGVTLRVTPTLGQEGGITLDLLVEVSAVVESIADSGRRVDLGDFDGDGYGADGDGYGGGDDDGSVGVGDPTIVGPTIQKRTLTTKVRLENDRVAVIGYQSGPRQVDVVNGTPFFQDIPILGWLFKSTTTAQFNNHLIITVAAWRDDEEIQALSTAMRRALAGNRVEVAQPAP